MTRTTRFLHTWGTAIGLLLSSNHAFAWHEVVALEHVATGRFVSVKDDGKLAADATTVGTKEKFTLLDLDFGELADKNQVALRTFRGQFVTAASTSEVRGNAASPGTAVRFEIRVTNAGSCVHLTRPGLCDGVTVQLSMSPGCLASDAADTSGAVTRKDCATAPGTDFRVRFQPEQPALLSLSAPFAVAHQARDRRIVHRGESI